LQKILKSQPKTAGGVAYPNKAEIHQHVHPISQRYHSSSKIRDEHRNPFLSDFVPNSELSSIYPISQYKWQELTGRQKQELLHNRCALVVSNQPYKHDNQEIAFDVNSFIDFTHLDCPAFVQDTPSFILLLADTAHNTNRSWCQDQWQIYSAKGWATK
jgi:hypothetical protein